MSTEYEYSMSTVLPSKKLSLPPRKGVFEWPPSLGPPVEVITVGVKYEFSRSRSTVGVQYEYACGSDYSGSKV
jgi:hypothetical protein